MSIWRRLRQIVDALLAARLPAEPKRKYDLISEAMARPFGGQIGRGRYRQGGTSSDRALDTVPPRMSAREAHAPQSSADVDADSDQRG
jgi:hypothetical protein